MAHLIQYHAFLLHHEPRDIVLFLGVLGGAVAARCVRVWRTHFMRLCPAPRDPRGGSVAIRLDKHPIESTLLHQNCKTSHIY